MYLLVPLLLIVLSAGGIALIVYRKAPYLKKLTPESHELGDSIFEDFFPELTEYINRAKIKEYQKSFLKEIEKLVRRLRVFTLKIDHLSERLIKKIRHRHVTTHLEHRALLEEEIKEASTAPLKTAEETELDSLKAREQQLIIEIARDHKNKALYIELGDLYLKMHNIDEAKESFEAALALDPANIELARKYSSLLKHNAEVAQR